MKLPGSSRADRQRARNGQLRLRQRAICRRDHRTDRWTGTKWVNERRLRMLQHFDPHDKEWDRERGRDRASRQDPLEGVEGAILSAKTLLELRTDTSTNVIRNSAPRACFQPPIDPRTPFTPNCRTTTRIHHGQPAAGGCQAPQGHIARDGTTRSCNGDEVFQTCELQHSWPAGRSAVECISDGAATLLANHDRSHALRAEIGAACSTFA